MTALQTGPAATARWLARGGHDLPLTDDWLTSGEAGRAASMRFTKRRNEYLLRRWVGKNAVATAAGLPTDLRSLARIEVANRRSGAPYVLVEEAPLGLDVSLTDRAGWAVCLVGPEQSRVGCDLEVVEPRSSGFVTDFLTSAEQAYVASAPEADRAAAATLVWSAKESALKVLRTGLQQDARSVEVTLEVGIEAFGAGVVLSGGDTGWTGLEVRTTEGRVLPGWWRRDRHFVLTVAFDRPLAAPWQFDGSADLARAEPVNPWLDRPVAD